MALTTNNIGGMGDLLRRKVEQVIDQTHEGGIWHWKAKDGAWYGHNVPSVGGPKVHEFQSYWLEGENLYVDVNKYVPVPPETIANLYEAIIASQS
jgi:hypothetical protein